MKKTIIALMALAGVAIADTGTAMNTELKGLIKSTGYSYGDTYTLTFNIIDVGSGGESNISYLQMASDYYLFTQGNQHVGLTSVTGDPGGSWIGITETKDGVNTMAYDASTAKPTGFFTWNSSGQKGTLALGDNEGNNNANVVVTLSYDGLATTLTLAAPAVTEKIVIKNLSLNANDFVFNTGRYYLAGEVVSFVSAPEPTTATLSLLALCGLAARRRRK